MCCDRKNLREKDTILKIFNSFDIDIDNNGTSFISFNDIALELANAIGSSQRKPILEQMLQRSYQEHNNTGEEGLSFS